MKICGMSVGSLPEKPLGRCLLLRLPPHIDAACANAVSEVLIQRQLGFGPNEVFRTDLPAEATQRVAAGSIPYSAEGLPPGSCVVINSPALCQGAESSTPSADLLATFAHCALRYRAPESLRRPSARCHSA